MEPKPDKRGRKTTLDWAFFTLAFISLGLAAFYAYKYFLSNTATPLWYIFLSTSVIFMGILIRRAADRLKKQTPQPTPDA